MCVFFSSIALLFPGKHCFPKFLPCSLTCRDAIIPQTLAGVCAGTRAQPLSRVRLSATPRIVVHQAPLSMGFSRQEYWSGLPRPHPGNLPDPGMEPTTPTSPVPAGGFFTTEPTFLILMELSTGL